MRPIMNMQSLDTNSMMRKANLNHKISRQFKIEEEWQLQDKEHQRLIDKFKTISDGKKLAVESFRNSSFVTIGVRGPH